ncbi:hypothetical protein MNB_SM-3-31 [hydrothermal vent metagenome]|uniref:Uncharacterized protein n=1 Tax=hydrothermal vent metagenome TaxID=652676 RepID=A0A1W1D3V9_9ZZZZ
MNTFVKKVIDWIMEKEEEMAKENAIPLQEVEYQIAKVKEEKQKLQKQYDDAIKELNHIEEKLEKIKNIEIIRSQNK